MINAAESNSRNQSLEWVRDWIQNHTGIVFPDHKMPILEQRLKTHVHNSSYTSLEALAQDLRQNPSAELINKIIEVATTNHTHFFREFEAIQFLIDNIIPQLLGNSSIRLWSAAASSGEELYTICMALFEAFGAQSVSQRFSFLGTDVNAKVVAQAEKGIYCTSRLEYIPAALKEKWFLPAGLDAWSLKDEIKSQCLFRRLNLLSHPWPFMKKFHITFLRNILYYFDTDTQKKLLLKLYQATEPGGWLIVSVTENITSLDLPWQRVQSNVFKKPMGAK